jgi:GABA(A) receptor-associated protein
MEYIKEFKSKSDWTSRLSKTKFLRNKYPDRIPVIIDRSNTYTPKPTSHKYLVPSKLTVGEFLFIIRQHIPNLDSSEALYLFIVDKNTIPPVASTMMDIYSQHHDVDNYLYISFSIESTFG